MPFELSQRVLDDLLDGVWVIDADGRTTYVNRRMEEMLGFASGEMLGRPLGDFVPPDKHDQAQEAMARRRAGLGDRVESQVKCKDGSILDVWVLTNPIFDDSGSMIAAVAIVTDLSDLRSAQSERQAANERLERVLAQMPCVVWSLDRDLRVTTSMGSALQHLGLQNHETVGIRLFDYLNSTDERLPPVRHARMALAGEASTFEYSFNGRVYQTNMEPMRDSRGQIVGVLGVSIDITERKRAEQMLRQAHDELEQRVSERTAELRRSEEHYRELASLNQRLLAELHHRIRNNLFSLRSLIRLMRERHVDAQTFADAMEARLSAMTAVHELLAIEEWRPVEVGTLVRQLLAKLASLAPHPANVRVNGPAALISPRKAMPLAMVIQELFTNSCKYGAHSAPGGRVEVRWETIDSAEPVRIHLRWRETGGPPIAAPVTPSLGMTLIEQFAAAELGGAARLSFPAEGADHTIEIDTH